MSDRLSNDLRALAAVIDLPEPVSVATRVMSDPRLRPEPRATRRPIAFGLAAIVAIMLIVPASRQAIASLLGLGGTSITVVEELPEAASTGRPSGNTVSLDDAAVLAGFPILFPEDDPDEVLVDLGGPTPIVTLLFDDRLVITEFARPLQVEVFEKSVPATSPVESITIGEGDGYWIAGEHVLTYLDDVGMPREIPPRLVANTLLFEQGGITVRIETAGSLEEARAVAETLRPRN